MRVLDCIPGRYQPAVVHGGDRDWPESNCYVDLLLEIVHALGLEPRACLAFTLASDFEGDQWTFYKPPHGDLVDLYGLRIEELTVWRPVLEHVVGQVEGGRLPLVEVDAFYLPDTAQTDYRRQHTKTTIGVNAVDLTAERLEYFHNAGYYALDGDDFRFIIREIIVVKKNGRKSSFDRDKLSKSVYIALKKRPIDTETAEKFISKISRALEELGQSEISTNTIGTMVMEGLKELDPVAYVRFASVYRNFREEKDFVQFVDKLDVYKKR